MGFRTVGERIRSWGGVGALFGGVWGLLLAPTVFFFLPGLGLMATAGLWYLHWSARSKVRCSSVVPRPWALH
ncbi:hypothetical protein [Collimonas arenae]|uniref:hypothetical protein n=1 Tax=Collimonas arenae TaxID=279058 RepID=UPI001969D18D|nr:hypothetical protein [Collimonas arenae]